MKRELLIRSSISSMENRHITVFNPKVLERILGRAECFFCCLKSHIGSTIEASIHKIITFHHNLRVVVIRNNSSNRLPFLCGSLSSSFKLFISKAKATCLRCKRSEIRINQLSFHLSGVDCYARGFCVNNQISTTDTRSGLSHLITLGCGLVESTCSFRIDTGGHRKGCNGRRRGHHCPCLSLVKKSRCGPCRPLNHASQTNSV